MKYVSCSCANTGKHERKTGICTVKKSKLWNIPFRCLLFCRDGGILRAEIQIKECFSCLSEREFT